jgi:DNA-directed RNA polymerase III subunit RPC11
VYCFNYLQMATLFCPTCSNLLVISAETGYNKWACNTCPYEFPITRQMTSRTRLNRKQVDDVLGGDEMWKHADSTTGACVRSSEHPSPSFFFFCRYDNNNNLPLPATCEKCEHGRAYFYQLQIRSADEPMTTCKPVVFQLILIST